MFPHVLVVLEGMWPNLKNATSNDLIKPLFDLCVAIFFCDFGEMTFA
jgi:hypothetical protein